MTSPVHHSEHPARASSPANESDHAQCKPTLWKLKALEPPHHPRDRPPLVEARGRDAAVTARVNGSARSV
jgi:hypothetical protein